jgi:hypothetical protein
LVMSVLSLASSADVSGGAAGGGACCAHALKATNVMARTQCLFRMQPPVM